MGASYKVTRELLNEDKRQRFIVGDIDSILIEGTINVLNFRTRGMGWFFAHHGQYLRTVAPISIIVGLLILCSKNVLGL